MPSTPTSRPGPPTTLPGSPIPNRFDPSPANPQHPRQLLAPRAHRKPLRITNGTEAMAAQVHVSCSPPGDVQGPRTDCPGGDLSQPVSIPAGGGHTGGHDWRVHDLGVHRPG